MPYDIQITHIPDEHAMGIVARKLAGEDPAISLRGAMAKLDNLPVWYEKGLSKTDAAHHVMKLQRIGVQVSVVENEEQNEESKSAATELAALNKKPTAKPGPRPEPKPVHFGSASSPTGMPGKPARNRFFGKKSLIIQSIMILAVVGGIILISTVKSEKPVLQKGGNLLMSSESGKDPKDGRQVVLHHAGKPIDSSPKAKAERKSSSYVDSAKLVESDDIGAIKFYKIALSFNERNINAWHGLLNAYRDAGMQTEARKTQAKMKELFGGGVFSVSEVVSPYGRIKTYSTGEDRTLRVSYLTRTVGQSPLLRETFAIMRGLRSGCQCKAVSLYAETGPGEGMLVRLPMSPFPSNVKEYSQRAVVKYLE